MFIQILLLYRNITNAIFQHTHTHTEFPVNTRNSFFFSLNKMKWWSVTIWLLYFIQLVSIFVFVFRELILMHIMFFLKEKLSYNYIHSLQNWMCMNSYYLFCFVFAFDFIYFIELSMYILWRNMCGCLFHTHPFYHYYIGYIVFFFFSSRLHQYKQVE